MSEWISVKDRLPNEDGEYLVTFEQGYREDYNLSAISIIDFEVDYGFGFWQEHFDVHSLGSLGSDWVDIPVIAWMPLPEPYKEDAEC